MRRQSCGNYVQIHLQQYTIVASNITAEKSCEYDGCNARVVRALQLYASKCCLPWCKVNNRGEEEVQEDKKGSTKEILILH